MWNEGCWILTAFREVQHFLAFGLHTFLCCRTSFCCPSEEKHPYQMHYLQFMQQKSSIPFLMQQSKLQISIILESQKYQDEDDVHHDLTMEVDLMSLHLLEPTITILSLKLVIFYQWS